MENMSGLLNTENMFDDILENDEDDETVKMASKIVQEVNLSKKTSYLPSYREWMHDKDKETCYSRSICEKTKKHLNRARSQKHRKKRLTQVKEKGGRPKSNSGTSIADSINLVSDDEKYNR
eukprot:UN20859